MLTYTDGYRAFSEDPNGFYAQAVHDHFSGKMRLDSTVYGDDWFQGYQDAVDDFDQAQQGDVF